MDTPGMRELQLSDCEQGVHATFSEITDLAEKCRFGDCSHISEPGCAVLKAVESGELEERRLVSFQKLMREQAINGASVAEQRAKDKAFGKMVHGAIADARSRKKEYETSTY